MQTLTQKTEETPIMSVVASPEAVETLLKASIQLEYAKAQVKVYQQSADDLREKLQQSMNNTSLLIEEVKKLRKYTQNYINVIEQEFDNDEKFWHQSVIEEYAEMSKHPGIETSLTRRIDDAYLLPFGSF